MSDTERKKDSFHAKGLVAASLALNLFLAGVLVGPWLGGRASGERLPPPDFRAMQEHDGPRGPMPPPGLAPDRKFPREGGPAFPLMPFMENLSPEEAKGLIAIFEAERGQEKDHRAKLDEAFAALADAIKAPAPDEAAIEAALKRIEEGGDGMHETMHRVMRRIAKEMPAETRAKIATAMEKRPNR